MYRPFAKKLTSLCKKRREDKKELAGDVRKVLSPDDQHYTKEQASKAFIKLSDKWIKKYKALGNHLSKMEWQPYFTYLDYHVKIRRMIYTTNWIERFNKSCRRTLKIRGAFPNEESVLALITSTAIEKTGKNTIIPFIILNLNLSSLKTINK